MDRGPVYNVPMPDVGSKDEKTREARPLKS